MNKILPLFFILLAQVGLSQTKITWKSLNDVTFEDKYSEEVDAYYYYPTFGEKIKTLDGKEVYLKGFVLDLDPTGSYYILSKHPYASCFFCGTGGPDSIVELNFKSKDVSFTMDQEVTIKGRLKLNSEDIYQCNYVFEDAEVYSK